MEPTSEPDHRQSRGLARFWPGPGMSTPAPRDSAAEPDAPHAVTGDAAPASDQQAGEAGPTGEHPQVSDQQQSQPHDDDQPEAGEQSPNPFAPRPNPALTSDTQMVALGSRRPADALLGGNGARWSNQGGFPPVETNGHRNGDLGPRHGGGPIINGPAPTGGLTGSRFAPAGDDLPPSFPPGDQSFPPGDAPFPAGDASFPAGDPSFRSAADEQAPRPPAFPAGDAAFLPAGDQQSAPSGYDDDVAPDPRQAFGSAPAESAPGPRQPFTAPDGVPGARSPFAPADQDGPAGPPFAPSPFAPHASGSATVTGSTAGQQATAPQQPTGRPVSAAPAASGSAQVPVPMPGRSESTTPPGPAPSPAAEPTRLEPTGWATAAPRPGASGSATVPVSPSGGRRSRDHDLTDEPAAPAPRRSTSLDDATGSPAGRRAARAEGTPLRPGDVTDHSISFWTESASEQFRAEWHEVKAQFVDDPEAALTRAHDLLTEAVHELTESMLAERDDLDPLRGVAKPDTESMRMAMRGYREFLDRILAL